MSGSSLSSVVSGLVRASMGSTVPSTVTDEDLDRHIGEIILREAKQKAERYKKDGIRAYLPAADPNVPRTNKRFLTSIIRSTDDHNKAVLRSQAVAAAELKEEREEQERRERRARADEAAQERLRSLMSGGRRRATEDRWHRDSDGEHRSRKRRDRDRNRTHQCSTKDRSRSRSGERKRYWDEDEDEYRSRMQSSRRRRHESERRSDRRHRRGRSSSRSRSSRRETSKRYSRSRSSRRETSKRYSRSRSPTGSRSTSHCRRRNRNYSSSHSRSPRRNAPASKPSRSPSVAKTPEHSSRTRRALSPSPSPRVQTPKSNLPAETRSKASTPIRDATRSPSPLLAHLERTPSPPPISSKMDKYFAPTYDPRLDVAPLASSSGLTVNVPATGLIDNAQFEGWDAMLELIRVRREDRAEKKRLERLGLGPEKERDKDGRGKKGKGMVSATVEDGKGIMEIAYQKKGAVREWDMGKEGF